MKKYKLTDQNMKTCNGFQWELGKEVITDGNSKELCNNQWLHYYHHPLLAVLLNPVHANIRNPRLFEIKALGKHLNDTGLKGGCTRMTLVKELEVPVLSLTQKVAFGILCALEIYTELSFILWANNWLNNIDRSTNAAAAYVYTVTDAAAYAYVAADSATAAAAAYAYVAAVPAAAYAYAAATADAAAAAYANADAAANVAAARATIYAARVATDINLIAIAKKCLKY